MALTVQDMVKVGIFTSLTVAVAIFTRFSAGIVPFSFLPLMVILAGSILGSKLGSLSMLTYLILGLVGIPVFASQPFGGLAYVFQPSFGFLIGFIFGAFAVGKVIESSSYQLSIFLLAGITGILVINIFGLIYFWVLFNYVLSQPMSVSKVLKVGLMPFIVPDIFKALVAGFLGFNVHKRLKA